MKVAVVGATGLVGKTMLRILEERKFPVTELIPVATANSAGKKVMFSGREYTVVTCEEAVAMKADIALFSAGGTTSLEWAPRFAQVGTTVIDNSSAWRMNEKCSLIVPEINADVLTKEDKIIANPNCSTIQMVMVLNPLHKKYQLKRVVVSTYQSVSGTGKKAVDQLMNERKGISGAMAYPYNIDLNVLPHVDSFLENGYTKEEMKMVNETRKILRSDEIKVTATTVRVPVVGGHSEAVNAAFEKQFEMSDVKQLLSHAAGVTVIDDPAQLQYPMPTFAEGKDDVFVGRIRRDESQPNTLNLWVVADNLRKGAATNAVQIAEYLLKQSLI
ncbi:MAG TPA: aspartate-semialdehyde dehydrogenase [Bacteroidia bacterium]|nr:aspartate-semialdehyde dehydrogenase [Bacteroidia bacterium]HMU20199.1 aspartate-semialdehyde dehydrogenase [Bacteroidia bacterium]